MGMVDLAGPMCFQGDYLAKEVELPTPAAGDILAIHDTGAYTMAMYCKFNSIRASPVYGYWKYRDQLDKEAPELFSGKYKIVTEMGRSLFLKSGTSLTRVEYVKDWVVEQNPILLTHLGTNQFPRSAYLPHIWRHRFSIFTPAGACKEGDSVMVDLAGPMCFQGDYLAKEVELPTPTAGDILAIHDTGAYTMAMYCNPVYGYWRSEDGL